METGNGAAPAGSHRREIVSHGKDQPPGAPGLPITGERLPGGGAYSRGSGTMGAGKPGRNSGIVPAVGGKTYGRSGTNRKEPVLRRGYRPLQEGPGTAAGIYGSLGAASIWSCIRRNGSAAAPDLRSHCPAPGKTS